MPDEVTAALEAVDTVAEPVVAPEPVEAAETVDEVPAAETVQPEPTETESPAPERPSLRDLLDGRPDDELEADERIQSLIARKQESARQRERDHVLREAGKREATRQRVTQMLNEWGVDPDEVGPGGLVKAETAYTLAEQAALHEFLSAVAKASADNLGFTPEQRQAIEVAVDNTRSLDGLRDIANNLMEQSNAAAVSKAQQEFEREKQKLINEAVAAELRAKEIEAQPKRDAPPATPGGTGGGRMTVAELDAIDTNTWLRKSPEERARLMAEANALVGR
jgi:hypothetical protein